VRWLSDAGPQTKKPRARCLTSLPVLPLYQSHSQAALLVPRVRRRHHRRRLVPSPWMS
jgi:hypothetical protein